MTSKNAENAGASLYPSSDVYSTNHLLQTNHRAIGVYLSRIYFSKACRSFYVALIVLCLVLVTWTLVNFGHFPEEGWFLGLEVFVSGMIIGEVVGRLVMQGLGKFCRSWLNVFDAIVASLSIIVLLEVLNSLTLAADIEGLLGEVWLAIRTVLQYLRLVVFIKNQKKAQVLALQVINFTELAQPSPRREPEIQMVEGAKLHVTEEYDEKDDLDYSKH